VKLTEKVGLFRHEEHEETEKLDSAVHGASILLASASITTEPKVNVTNSVQGSTSSDLFNPIRARTVVESRDSLTRSESFATVIEMEEGVQTSGTAALRARLRDTWLHDLLVHYRDIRRRVMRRSEGEAILLHRYAQLHGKPLNLMNPRTFTEKLFWRMVTWNRGAMPSRFRQLADKYAVRNYVANRIGEEYLIKLLWQGDDPRAIPFDRLPAEYVIKPNHSSGEVIIVRGEANREDIIRQVSGWLANNYYWQDREYQYYGIKPKAVIEEYLKSQDDSEPLDYRFWCFGGVPAVIQVDNHAKDINPFFDAHWNQLALHTRKKVARPSIPQPTCFEHMFELARRLSQEIGFIRVDLYNTNGRVYCGELTLTPGAGIFQFGPDHWDLKLGEKWDLTLDY